MNEGEEVGEVVDEVVGAGGKEVGGAAVAIGDTAGGYVGVAAHKDVDGHVADYKGLVGGYLQLV